MFAQNMQKIVCLMYGLIDGYESHWILILIVINQNYFKNNLSANYDRFLINFNDRKK